ncbi:MAG TPA: hypothetical protein VMM56_06930 [Planctomycetaceae bacterium]|nr:hypothetical protein [Planctomycetaceae bacterium]
MKTAFILAAGLTTLVATVAETQAGGVYASPYYYSYYPAPAPYLVQSSYVIQATPVFSYPQVYVAPQTVVVQRPVFVAQPVVVPEPVFVEVPATVLVQPAPVMPVGYATTASYRPPLFPFFHRDKTEYRVHTPFGTHKYKYKTSWWTGRTKFEYDFND